MKTLNFNSDTVTVEITEFELVTLSALVERGLTGLNQRREDNDGIYQAIHRVAGEFRALGGHFELVNPAA